MGAQIKSGGPLVAAAWPTARCAPSPF